jgi:hypothetical protein
LSAGNLAEIPPAGTKKTRGATRIGCYAGNVNATTLPAHLDRASTDADRVLQDGLRLWLHTYHSFRAWERQHILLEPPDANTLAAYRDVLQKLRLLIGIIGKVAEDTDPLIISEIRCARSQLEESWARLNNPLTADQAAEIEAKLFGA